MSEECSDRPLILLSALLRALAHKIRTPLSVISNDLTFIKSTSFEVECARDLAKVKQISDLLRRCTSSVLQSATFSSLTSTEICERITAVQLRSSDSDSDPKIKVELDPQQLNIALDLIAESLRNFSPKPTAEPQPVCGEISQPAPQLIKITIGHPFTSFASITDGARFNSLTALFNDTLDSDLPWPPIADAIIWNMNGTVQATALTDSISIDLSLPFPGHPKT